MIFFTLGTQLPFDRMTRAMDDWCAATGRGDVFGQISDPGRNGYRPKRFDWVERMPPDDFERTLASADLVVAHAGMGSLISALSLGKLIVVMPRLARYGEHRNDHQRATVERFADRPGVMAARDEDELPEILNRALELAGDWRGARVPPFAEPRLIDAIRKAIGAASDERGREDQVAFPSRPVETDDRKRSPMATPGAREGAVAMYEVHFGLNERPFGAAPDPRFLYPSAAGELALGMLRYAVMTRAPLTVVTGGAGVGKTTLLRQMMVEAPEATRIGLIPHARAGRGELLRSILKSFDQPCDDVESRNVLLERLLDFLAEVRASGARATLIIDEAQNLRATDLEDLRMIGNMSEASDDLLQTMLFGQSDLRARLAQSDLASFAQRIDIDFSLEPLSAEETAGYVRRRLSVAGAERELFDERALALIHDASEGLPRLINQLCDLCMASAFSDGRPRVDEALPRELLESFESRGIYAQFRRGQAAAHPHPHVADRMPGTVAHPKSPSAPEVAPSGPVPRTLAGRVAANGPRTRPGRAAEGA